MFSTISARVVSEEPPAKMLGFPADWLWRFNFVTVALVALEYLKRLDKAVPAYGAVRKPINKELTSGCPKNQNRCWYRTGSPPPVGLKKTVLKLRSIKSMVIARSWFAEFNP